MKKNLRSKIYRQKLLYAYKTSKALTLSEKSSDGSDTDEYIAQEVIGM